MSARSPLNVTPGLALSDIYHVLFRRKFAVLSCSFTGFAAAATLFFLFPAPYESEAKLFIRYVSETRNPTPSLALAKSPDQRGETILDSEMEIITSRDLALKVAAAVGPATILGPAIANPDAERAASTILQNLHVASPPRSSVIRLVYRHPDRHTAQRVLQEIVAHYFQTHLEIHRAAGLVGDFLDLETSQLRNRLAKTEDALRDARRKAGVISLDETKTAYAAQITSLRQQIFATQADIAERQATLRELTQRGAATASDSSSASAAPASAAAASAPDDDVLAAYRNIQHRLAYLRGQERELLTQFREENARVQDVRTQIAEVDQTRRTLEEQHPQLRDVPAIAAPPTAPPLIDPAVERIRLASLEAKLKTLNAQLEQVRNDAAAIDTVEPSIVELHRRQELEEANYRHYSQSLEQARLDEALGAGSVTNISQIQKPSRATRDIFATLKWVALLACGGVATGLGWAFLVELYLDRTVRRPIDIERLLQPPLFLSVPRLHDTARLALTAPGSGANGSASALVPFHDTLRDQLINFFEVNGLVHKPKLVGVSGLGRGAGISTTAVGLARSLSELQDCNVLLVDLTHDHESARHFARGQQTPDLDHVLDSPAPAMVDANLYVAAEPDRPPRDFPQRFSRLVPRLKASDFDYIIFDLPAVSPTSISPRLARLMDMTLLVVEAGSTEQEVLHRAVSLLSGSNVPVGVVLNKARTYVPAWLKQDFVLPA